MQKWIRNCICFPGEKLCHYANNISGGVHLLFLFFLLSLGAYCDGFDFSAQGTPPYMAPEIILGASPTAAADIYSLGVLLYRMLTGMLPAGIARPTVGECAPVTLPYILAKATEFTPQKRYESIQAFWDDFSLLKEQFIMRRDEHVLQQNKASL